MGTLCLSDKIYRGMGVAARRLGAPYIVYRPAAGRAPLSSRNRIIKLNAAFSIKSGALTGGTGYGRAVWIGTYDASYTQPGDYLVGPAGTFFVSSQEPLMPVQCVKTNRTVTLSRPSNAPMGGYSGFVVESATTIEAGWPASILSLSAKISGNLPEYRYGNWSILLPSLPNKPQVGDVLTDDVGRTLVISVAEFRDLGWRLTGREISG